MAHSSVACFTPWFLSRGKWFSLRWADSDYHHYKRFCLRITHISWIVESRLSYLYVHIVCVCVVSCVSVVDIVFLALGCTSYVPPFRRKDTPFRSAPRVHHFVTQVPPSSSSYYKREDVRKKPKCGWEVLPSLKLTWHLKIHHWKKGDSYWKPSFLGAMLVSGRVIHSAIIASSLYHNNGKHNRIVMYSAWIFSTTIEQHTWTFPKGAKLFLKGFNSPSLGVSLAPLGRCGALDSPRSMGS